MIETFISPHSTCTTHCRTVVFFFGGVLTYRNNFEDAACEIAKKYEQVKIVMIFPYGTANQVEGASLIPLLSRQLTEVTYDMARASSTRVQKISQIIRDQAIDAEHILLIGHSAGGVIAYRTGLYLEKYEGFNHTQVFAVGSPKFYLKDIPFNNRFTYITGQNPDKITRIGSWRIPGSKIYSGTPGHEIQMNFNPDHRGRMFHATYFLKSAWTDANEVFHTNAEDLISKIHELYPGKVR
ncbi:hypothetical protein J2Z69_000978 [Paenibacillus shirakamiensis]|uniref:Alpha/beta hydrolase n=1 Tax=Paenibacillus shirakamiensis TaxID=1265935 RepID=A0ABS4JE08_9BACL|nr:alpha/beta hydrolase [Paenibacillus shirakamiensis]MBP1999959.1 hypothetical protein [Paenibacillus shirakamiensis]